jgi:SAM-dependent methyltransferase
MTANQPEELRRVYGARFAKNLAYRQRVWRLLVAEFFQSHVTASAALLDLGCGYGEFINSLRCGRKLAMDLNPDAQRFLAPDVQFLQQDCSSRWPCADESLDVVFTSNFFEHLPSKEMLGLTLQEVFRCLKPGGKLLAMGPNIRFLPGAYWDFWDHHLPLSDRSLAEALESCGFSILENHPRFLPYTMVNQLEYPLFMLSLYLKLPLAWRLFGKQFLIIAQRP